MQALSFFQARTALLAVSIFSIVMITAACGQVITLTPTPAPTPTPTIGVVVMAATVPPTSTPAPYTPEPTATSTVTPTPVFHVIQSGESLLAVANQYDISVNALQDANGITDPRLLQVGQQLIIPSEEVLEEEEQTTPTPTPLPFDVVNLNLSETTLGGLWVLGEVLNTGATPLEQVRVGVTLLGEDEAVVEQAESLVALDLVDAGERSPFALLFGAVPGEFERYTAYPAGGVPAHVGSYYRDFDVRDLEGANTGTASYTVSGVIFNLGPEEAVDVRVVVTAYDPLDRVIAMRKITPEHNVVPRGGETTFSAVLAPLGGPVARVAAIAEGRRVGQ